ncbi:MAG: DUF4910 domain-containing protein [Lachnospiraceae bacterium]|nr:DUF4910 domain-containing protein [Lachnospiraceae bacterium]
MDTYIRLKDIAGHLHLKKGDNVYVTSDVKQLLYDCMQNNDDTDLNILIDGIIDIIGEDATLVFPTFNWSFCKGEPYDGNKTPCKTGSIGKTALKRGDFARTQHPIYSFAVWGKDKEELCALTNSSSFGDDSPFNFMVERGYRNLFIDKDTQHSFVFVHYAEQSSGQVPYRYLKDFTADYTDASGNTHEATYSMNVRNLGLDVENTILPLEDEFIEKGIEDRFYINGIEYKIIELKDAHPIMVKDVLTNRSRRICSYIGQDDDPKVLGESMYGLAERLFPICRSITGAGVRETFEILKEYIPDLKLYEVPTGTKVMDWTVPKEWRIDEAYIEDDQGNRIVDFRDNNLHVLGYSVPVDEWMSFDELEPHIYTLKDQPELIPYVTSYYKERWGFAMSQVQKDSLHRASRYHAVIKSSLFEGNLTYGELVIPATAGEGKPEKEVFLSTYICHPSMANNECSGPSLMAHLCTYIKGIRNRKYSYRIVFVPETIGAITYLSRNLGEMKEKVIAGFNLTCVGDDRDYSIVHSRYGDTLADRVLTAVLKEHCKDRSDADGPGYSDYSYLKRGSDERQYQAPGVDLPLVCFCRSKYHVYPEYHTSGDNMSIVSPEGFYGAYSVMRKCIDVLEGASAFGEEEGERIRSLIASDDRLLAALKNADMKKDDICISRVSNDRIPGEDGKVYKVTCLCEPQLGKRGLVPTMSSKETYQETLAMKDVLAYADGTHDVEELAKVIEQPVEVVRKVVGQLTGAGLLDEISR